MGFFDTKLSFSAMKDAVTDAAIKVSETVQSVDVKGTIISVKETAVSVTERTTEVTKIAYAATKEKAVSTYESVSEDVLSFDYTDLRRAEYYQKQYTHYTDLGARSVSEYFRATFEVDKSTMAMVEDVRGRLPVPAKNIDDIFDQCKREAMRRAIAAFALGGVVQDIDNRSEAKYANLSESYSANKDAVKYAGSSHKNYAAMSDQREAIHVLATLENGYNKDAPLFKSDADVEHVISRKDIYQDPLLRIGTTGGEMADIMNDPANLIFANSSLNSSKKEKDLMEYLSKNGRDDPSNPDNIIVTIKTTGQEVSVNRKDAEEAYDQADAKRNEHRLDAVMEVGMTVVKTGAAMAAQQVVGLIVLETIDIFVDEIRSLAANGRIFNEDGWLQNTKETTARVQLRLSERFEERQIWTQAKSLGIEAGVAGALSVIPQILISLIVKMPSFVLALIRECTLSTVRCARVLASDDADKFESIKIIMAGAATAIVGVYVGRAISSAIAGVPLLNRFNTPVTDVLTGLLVTAVPLTAIYTFEQNKHKLNFIASRFTGTSEQPA